MVAGTHGQLRRHLRLAAFPQAGSASIGRRRRPRRWTPGAHGGRHGGLPPAIWHVMCHVLCNTRACDRCYNPYAVYRCMWRDVCVQLWRVHMWLGLGTACGARKCTKIIMLDVTPHYFTLNSCGAHLYLFIRQKRGSAAEFLLDPQTAKRQPGEPFKPCWNARGTCRRLSP